MCQGPKLIILRGNSGSGKTSTAKRLQQRIGRNTLIISQDVIRRDMLWVKDGTGTPSLPLLIDLVRYGRSHCAVTILEGILDSKVYEQLFHVCIEEYGKNIYAYYYDLVFEETLRRHQTKPNCNEFGEDAMRSWWNEKDYMKVIAEKTILGAMSQDDTVEMICHDLKSIEWR